ncbi:unnamed protein product [Toxocara canis]|uniref:Uncharacterized protein n=1 Tax=Toxocara canis TaxID=6265 RepID=A0A183V4Y6_TOXCA|nr:unnamed protein product [Toxocara canis]
MAKELRLQDETSEDTRSSMSVAESELRERQKRSEAGGSGWLTSKLKRAISVASNYDSGLCISGELDECGRFASNDHWSTADRDE